MGVDPGHEGLRRPVQQHVDDAVALDVDEDRGVDVRSSKGEIIDTEHPWRVVEFGLRERADQPQQGGRAGRHAETGRQSGTGAARQGERDPLRRRPQRATPATVAPGQPVDLLDERPSWAPPVVADEAAHGQVNRDRAADYSAVGRPPDIAVLHPRRRSTTVRTHGVFDAARRTDVDFVTAPIRTTCAHVRPQAPSSLTVAAPRNVTQSR